ncbi:hypothetical protein H9645_03695 [Luteimonas sp. Sa2BVA3]|uniref:Terminase small subunit n=1 Tax=Luteimonas colneyensis TaxID=2762230 RepID=A0ABR8UGG8_9GAMM|nr:hypothetical protein [Luteimonas colneyensis]MBD7987125.1 hypothetical protein [Luteimonas colneyensis]
MAEPRELPATLGFRAFADLQGWRPSYITELKGKGHLVLTDDGRQVRVPESLAKLAALRDPSKIGVKERHAAARNVARTSSSTPGGEGQDAADVAPPTFVPDDPHAKRRAKALADQAEAAARKALRDEQVELGELIQREDVERVLADAATRLRTTLENVPATLAPELAATTDEARCRVLLANAIEHALEDLSRKFAVAGKGA